MDNLNDRRPIWIRLVALVFLVFSVLVLWGSIVEVSEALTNPEQGLSLYPRDMPPSSNIVMRKVYRIRFAVAVYNGLLAPVFIVGSFQLLRLRESGRKLLVWLLGLQIVVQILIAVFWCFIVVASLARPRIYPPSMGWGGLAASMIVGLVLFAVFSLMRSARVCAACSVGPSGPSTQLDPSFESEVQHAPNTLVPRDRNPRERGFRPVNSDR